MDYAETVKAVFGTDSHMNIRIQEEAAGVVVFLAGSLDMQSASALQELLKRVIGSMAAHSRLVIDMDDVNYIPSSGVGALTTSLMTARQRDISLRLRRIKPNVKSVFELLGFMSFFEETRVDA